MKKVIDIIYGIAMLLILGGALLADGLAEIRHGFGILIAIALWWFPTASKVHSGSCRQLAGGHHVRQSRRRASQEKA